MRSLPFLLALLACSNKKAEPPLVASSGSSVGSAVVAADASTPDAPAPDAPPPDATTDFVPATDVAACAAASQKLVTECLARALDGTIGDADGPRLADLARVLILAKDGAHSILVARAGDQWRAVGRVFTETTGSTTNTLTIAKIADVSHVARVDLKIEIVRNEGDDSDAETTKTASIICPRGADGTIAACSKPYMLVCNTKGYRPNQSSAKLELRPDGTMTYAIVENAEKYSPCALP